MDNSMILSVMTICIALITGVATIITLGVGGYGFYLQRTLVKKTDDEFKKHFDEMLNRVSEDPSILNHFIAQIVEKKEFKERFMGIMKEEIEKINQENSKNIDIIDKIRSK